MHSDVQSPTLALNSLSRLTVAVKPFIVQLIEGSLFSLIRTKTLLPRAILPVITRLFPIRVPTLLQILWAKKSYFLHRPL